MLQEIKELLLDLLYPCTCPGCGTPVPGRELLCEDCFRFVYAPHILVPELSWRFTAFKVFRYEGGIKTALHGAKFSGREEYLPRLAMALKKGMEPLKDLPWREENVLPAVIPIPTDPKRRKARGYDIPEEIFRPWTVANGMNFMPVLERTRPTTPQYGLTRKEREENLKDCFAVKKGAALPRAVILVDDILTTGSTLESAARTLRRAGVKRIYALVLASGHD
ncbi:MAG: ComF family protein [Acidaminococcus sp.]|jgi:ComF family protein|nr:ComF family protein [Acidaminococcus sp.]MCI2100198.1 ComF family protein [Acidaminococcus sp.]MCI2114517.1 ComF family protein [Acidaminococcus sp.]MCI2116479.1 ComF family protein [Acidaminococcus sp.]